MISKESYLESLKLKETIFYLLEVLLIGDETYVCKPPQQSLYFGPVRLGKLVEELLRWHFARQGRRPLYAKFSAREGDADTIVHGEPVYLKLNSVSSLPWRWKGTPLPLVRGGRGANRLIGHYPARTPPSAVRALRSCGPSKAAGARGFGGRAEPPGVNASPRQPGEELRQLARVEPAVGAHTAAQVDGEGLDRRHRRGDVGRPQAAGQEDRHLQPLADPP